MPKTQVEFRNITITVIATSPEAAYRKLCKLFYPATKDGWLEYTTDTYVAEDLEERTTALFS